MAARASSRDSISAARFGSDFDGLVGHWPAATSAEINVHHVVGERLQPGDRAAHHRFVHVPVSVAHAQHALGFRSIHHTGTPVALETANLRSLFDEEAVLLFFVGAHPSHCHVCARGHAVKHFDGHVTRHSQV